MSSSVPKCEHCESEGRKPLPAEFEIPNNRFVVPTTDKPIILCGWHTSKEAERQVKAMSNEELNARLIVAPRAHREEAVVATLLEGFPPYRGT
jgi:hypothetical protein